MIGVIARSHVAAAVGEDPTQWARPAWLTAGQARRLDPLARLAACAVDQLGLAEPLPPDTALAVGTAYGSVVATQRLLDGIAHDGDDLASPAAFSASVLSHVAGALGEALGLHGPVATISQGGTSALGALRWAWLQLAAGRASTAVVLAVDYHSPWTAAVAGRLLPGAQQSAGGVAGGAAAWVLRRDAGRELRVRDPFSQSLVQVDGGAPDPRAELVLIRHAAGRIRRSAPAMLGCWYPTAVLGVPLPDDACTLVECDRRRVIALWCGPHGGTGQRAKQTERRADE